MKAPKIFATILIAAAFLLVTGCGDDTTSPGNRTPSITGLSADPGTVDPTGIATITCAASDPDGDDLTYDWDADGGSLSGSGASVTWTAPLLAGVYEVSVIVEDTQGHTISDAAEVEVRGGTLLMKSRGGLMAVGMDRSSFQLFDGLVGVEVLGTRIFIGPSSAREIDYTGHDIGGPGRPDEVTQVTEFTMLPGGGVAFCENWTDSVFFVSAGGEFQGAVGLPDASSMNQCMYGIVVGGNLIISETGSRRLACVDLATHQASIFKDLSDLTGWLGDIEYLDGMYYLTQWESLYEFTETGEPLEILHIEDGCFQGVAVVGTSAFVSARNEDEPYQGLIYRVDLPTGNVETFAQGFHDPYEIEYLPVALTAP
jgi:hypothetical protein